MGKAAPTLAQVRADLDTIREVAKRMYAQEPWTADRGDAWTLEDYLACVDELEATIDRILKLPECTRERFEAKKHARNQIAQRLYYRGRAEPKTGRLGAFHTKRGEKGIDWEPTELSRVADRLAAEPLRQIYKATEACMD